MIEIITNMLSMCIPFSVALLLASTGEMFNQRAGVFNLGCEGVMAMGAFIGMLIPFAAGGGGAVSQWYNAMGFIAAAVLGAVFGIIFAVITVTFRAPQGIAGIGLQMFGVGTAGTLFRHFVGGTQSIPGIPDFDIPLLSKIPFIGDVFFSHNVMAYLAYLFIPVAWYILFRTPWGLRVRAVGTNPRAADSMGINVSRTRYEALVVGGALARWCACWSCRGLSLDCTGEDVLRYADIGTRIHCRCACVFRTLASASDNGWRASFHAGPDIPDNRSEHGNLVPL